MSNVRAREPVGPCHAFARVLVDAVNRRVPRLVSEVRAVKYQMPQPAQACQLRSRMVCLVLREVVFKGLAAARLCVPALARAARPSAVSGRPV